MASEDTKSKYDRWGPFPPIFKDLPVKVDDIKVVLYYNSRPYGERPGDTVTCLETRKLAREVKRVPGSIVPRKIYDFRKWQDRGILHLSEQEFSQRDIYFMIRWLSLHKKDLLFIIVNNDAHLAVKFFVDASDPSNVFVSSPGMKDSGVFELIDANLKNSKKEPINWSCV